MSKLGRVGIIANPVAQSGAAVAAAKRFAGMLIDRIGQDECRLLLTEHPGHATDMACDFGGEYDTLIVIGGDGIVHEAANGLLRLPSNERPAFAVVPVGSGNDYALTLGMSRNIEVALRQVLRHDARKVDVGCVNGVHFVETLSFGIDAAIALDTVERRKKSGRHGTILYVESGIDQVVNHRRFQAYEVTLNDADGGELHMSGQSYIFAVQIGQTYGGHFRVCPDADPSDGFFDVCIAHPPLSTTKALFIFMMAKWGGHTKFKQFEFHKASSLSVEFEEAPAAQVDGERIEGKRFEISMLPRELEVLVGDRKR